jgi:flavin reductase (DIM6/NTAB) family NADH-FMN oxidoreductase RutF
LHENKAMFDTLFKSVKPEVLNENFFRLIDKEWMLITAGTPDHLNTMTASWGTTGILWNLPIAVCFIRPTRYTFDFADKHDIFTLSFLGNQHKKILNFCGSHSGRDTDKIAKTGLKPVMCPNGGITFEQARLVLECKKLYADFLKEDQFVEKGLIGINYPLKDFHKFFIGEIKGCYQQDNYE